MNFLKVYNNDEALVHLCAARHSSPTNENPPSWTAVIVFNHFLNKG